LRDVRALFSQAKERTFLRAHDRARPSALAAEGLEFDWQLSDLVEIQLLGAEEAFRALRRFIISALQIMNSCLHGSRYLDFQLCDSEIDAHRGYLQLDDYWVEVLTLKELPKRNSPASSQGTLRDRNEFPRCHEWRASTTRKHEADCLAPQAPPQHQTSFLSNLEEKGIADRRMSSWMTRNSGG